MSTDFSGEFVVRALAKARTAQDLYDAGIIWLEEYLGKVNEIRAEAGIKPLTMEEFNPLKIRMSRGT